ncbi:hypothetical protein [Burkholderia plantarii]|uniref:hypothetical protein n=1 Tax=Burkholderia plantarii TaxID=41899 RepID=UPI000706300B|nr:hypothetical protein [Burkholderia plantarii]ALK30848.1 hypothetical protein bpln_1g20600 [Burkholderia plantarii]GLZ19478.1 hypothetical protein Bpla01_30080 [Burkholderia plantarii]
MTTAFTRQLGAESGVQLNPLRDDSEIPSTDNSDQIFGIVMRATRGRIDKPFVVDKGNVFKRLGSGEQVRLNALNEAWVCVVEALNKGAYQAVVQRLVPSTARISYAIVTVERTPDAKSMPTGKFTYSVDEVLPSARFLFAVRHLECFNDGIVLEFHAEEKTIGSSFLAPNDRITLRLRDTAGGLLYEFSGSLNQDAKDDYGNSAYLPDVVASQTDAVDVAVGAQGIDARIAVDSEAYGYGPTGQQQWARSGVLRCFDEGGTSYTTQDYMAAREKLQYTQFDYAYLSSGATEAPALLAQLAQLSFDTNRQLKFDVPGDLSVDAARAFVDQLNMGASETAHLLHAFWAPLKSDDPTGVNPKGFFGTATLNIAYACLRNAAKNAKGFARKNYPIAGREWPIQRTGVAQMVKLRDQDKNALARAKINPVVYETYTGGGRYVFLDSLTCAQVDSSLKKLISVADMSTSIDDAVTRTAKDYLQLPIAVSVKKTQDFLTTLFEAADASKWLVPSSEPSMNGRSWVFDVRPNAQRPYDAMDVSYWLRYDGTNRATFVTQTLTR